MTLVHHDFALPFGCDDLLLKGIEIHSRPWVKFHNGPVQKSVIHKSGRPHSFDRRLVVEDPEAIRQLADIELI